MAPGLTELTVQRIKVSGLISFLFTHAATVDIYLALTDFQILQMRQGHLIYCSLYSSIACEIPKLLINI